MTSDTVKRTCPYCGSTKLTYLEHGVGGTLFQCQLCSRAAVQRWEPEAETIPKTGTKQEFVFPSWFTGVDGR